MCEQNRHSLSVNDFQETILFSSGRPVLSICWTNQPERVGVWFSPFFLRLISGLPDVAQMDCEPKKESGLNGMLGFFWLGLRCLVYAVSFTEPVESSRKDAD